MDIPGYMLTSLIRMVLLYSLLAMLAYSARIYAASAGKHGPALEESAGENQIKVVFLANMAEFVTWPGESDMAIKQQPFVIAIMGKTPMMVTMEDVFLKRKIKNRPVNILVVPDDGDVPHCHLLFLTRSVKPRIAKIIAVLNDKPVLLVSDSEGFAQKGAHINFYIRRNKLKFEINETAVRSTQLEVSYHLFSYADRIINPTQKRRHKRGN